MIKNNKGFAFAFMTALLPILVAGLLACSAIVYFIKTDSKLKYICREGGIAGQTKVAPLLEALLAMNIKASQLRFELAQAILKAASGSVADLARLSEIRSRILVFKTKQQQLIQHSNIILRASHLRTQAQLWRESPNIHKGFPLLNGALRVDILNPPALAVHPDIGFDPPIYQLNDDFAREQALEHKWHYRLTVLKRLQPFMSGDFHFNKSCAVTLKLRNSRWQPQIELDKYWLKSR